MLGFLRQSLAIPDKYDEIQEVITIKIMDDLIEQTTFLW
jgi:hypothetical protein